MHGPARSVRRNAQSVEVIPRAFMVEEDVVQGIMTLQLPDDDRLIQVAAELLAIQAGAERLRIA